MKSIEIRGKSYIPVNERVKEFRAKYPDLRVLSEIVSLDENSVVMKATVVDMEGHALATGYAQEDRNSSNINKTSYVENCECVPLGAKILTWDGWKFYYEVNEGDDVLTYNPDTHRNEWLPLQKVSVYTDKPVIKVQTSRFMSVFTKGHRWLVNGAMTPYEDIPIRNKITTMPKPFPVVASNMGERLGWLLGDCVIKYTDDGLPSNAEITQAKYVDEVTALFGEGNPVNGKEGWQQSYKWYVPAKEVRRVFGHFHISSYKDLPNEICKWTLADIKGFYEASMLCDGTKDKRVYAKTDKELVEAMQTACTLLGIKTGKITSKIQKGATRPIYLLQIHSTDGAYKSEFKETCLPPQDVWCPTTANGNWYCSYKGYQYLTGNTSAVGRALGMFGIGIDASMASADEVANAIDRQEALKQKIDKNAISALKLLAEEKGSDLTMILSYCELEKIEDMTMEQWQNVMAMLKRKK